MRHHLHTEIEIDAPTAVVWDVLTDLDRYEEWNPFIVESSGTVAVGQRLTNRMQPPGGRAVTFTPTVTEVEPGRVFEWLGHLLVPGLFDGRHRFELHETVGGGTRLVHTEHFGGVLVRPFKRSLDRSTLAGFEALNDALRRRAEARVDHEG
ncbi:MAG: SRPBCC domain-containing protein [Actinomycetota bacterium]